MDWTKRHIEALIFAAQQPVSIEEIQAVLEESLGQSIDIAFLDAQISELIEAHQNSESSIEIQEIDGGFLFLTKPEFHNSIQVMLKQSGGKKLTNAALETLAIIAYKQPVTKTMIESIRGVQSDYLIQKLLDKDLITITGRDDSPGRPLLYATSERFMDYFGLKDIKDLPKLKDFKMPENTIGVSDLAMEN